MSPLHADTPTGASVASSPGHIRSTPRVDHAAVVDLTTVGPRPSGLALDDVAADLLFRAAHTGYQFSDQQVSDESMRAVFDLIRWAPTAMNSQPMRVTLVRSEQARADLIGRLSPGNRAKSESAPLIAILSYDVDFHDTLAEVAPHSPTARDSFVEEASRHRFGQLNAAMQAAYFLLGVRAAGLTAGPMGGFDRSGVDEHFFPGGRQRSFLVVNIGHVAPEGIRPRSPRLPYARVVQVV